jgi:hypothetical protein
MNAPKKPIIDETPIEKRTNVVVEGRSFPSETGGAISSDKSIGDRPMQKHYNRDLFVVLAVVALIILLGIAYVYLKPSAVGPTPHSAPNPNAPSSESR